MAESKEKCLAYIYSKHTTILKCCVFDGPVTDSAGAVHVGWRVDHDVSPNTQ